MARSSNMKMIVREFKQDKTATIFFFSLTLLIVVIYVWSAFLDTNKIMTVDILNQYAPPGKDGMLLGSEQGGRNILYLLVVGTRNSLSIGFAVTFLSQLIGISFGLIAGYYGGKVDNVMMRFLDFMMTLPMLMLVIVIVSIIPNYSMTSFVLIMSAFYWIGTARLIRSRTLAEANREYISASKTLGTSDLVIIFRELLPNLSSLIIVEAILNLTSNIGIEVGLSFLGFGLPESVPSLGTLIGYAQEPEILTGKIWVWLPAALLILLFCVGFSYIGNVIRRAFDARQRLG